MLGIITTVLSATTATQPSLIVTSPTNEKLITGTTGATGTTTTGATGTTTSGATGTTTAGATGTTTAGATGETTKGATGETTSGATGETTKGATGETTSGATGATQMLPEDFNDTLNNIEQKMRAGGSLNDDEKNKLSQLLDHQASTCQKTVANLTKIMPLFDGSHLSSEEIEQILSVIDKIQEHSTCGSDQDESIDAEDIMQIVQARLHEIINGPAENFQEAIEDLKSLLIAQIYRINNSSERKNLFPLRQQLFDILYLLRNIKQARRYYFRRMLNTLMRYRITVIRNRIQRRRRFRQEIVKFITNVADRIRAMEGGEPFSLNLIIQISQIINLCIANRFFGLALRLQRMFATIFGVLTPNFFVELRGQSYYDTLIAHMAGKRFVDLIHLLLSHSGDIITRIIHNLRLVFIGEFKVFKDTMNEFNSAIIIAVDSEINLLDSTLLGLERAIEQLDQQILDDEGKNHWSTIIADQFPDLPETHRVGFTNWLYGMAKYLRKTSRRDPKNLAELYGMSQYTSPIAINNKLEFENPAGGGNRVIIFRRGSCNKQALIKNAQTFMAKNLATHFKDINDDLKKKFDQVFEQAKEQFDKNFTNCCTCETK